MKGFLPSIKGLLPTKIVFHQVKSMSNISKPLVNIFLLDFGGVGGSCLSSCCCDGGKTKLTASVKPKPEV